MLHPYEYAIHSEEKARSLSSVHTHRLSTDPARVLFPLGLGVALSLTGDSTMYTVLPTHTAEAGITLASVGVMLGANRAIRLFLNGPAGLAYDRWPRRRLFVPALFLGALSTALSAATRGFWPLLAARLLWGVAWSGIWVGGATMILDVAAPEARGRWTGLLQTWFFFGAAATTLLGGFLTDQLGYHVALWVGTALTAAGGVVALILLPETRGAARARASTDVVAPPPATEGKSSGLLAAMSLYGLSRFVGSGVLSAIMALIVERQMGPTALLIGVATLTGLLSAGRTLLSMAAAPLSGLLSDRTAGRWGVTSWALGLGVTGFALMAWGAPGAVVAGVLLASASAGGVQSLATTLAGDLTGARWRGRAIGLLHTAGDLGSALAPPIAYALLPWAGLRGLYLLCAAMSAAGLLPALLYRAQERVGDRPVANVQA